MKKLIDIPEEIVKDLKKMAIDADKEQKTSTNVKSKRSGSNGA